MRLLLAFSLILFSGCKTLEIAVKHPTSGVHIVARIDARDERLLAEDGRCQQWLQASGDRLQGDKPQPSVDGPVQDVVQASTKENHVAAGDEHLKDLDAAFGL